MTEPRSVFFELHERLRHAIVHRLRWRELRPVQEETVRTVREGLNAIVLAPTAGGKTEASVFGVLDGLLREPTSGIAALYLSPLRALLNNQELRLKELTRMVGFDAFKWHGDVSASEKSKFIDSPQSLLMTTPESLEVILMTERYDQQQLFGQLRYVVIDEIHGFAGDDRGDHLLALLERLSIVSQVDFQRIGLSATVGNPEQLLEWVQGSSQRQGRVVNPGGPRQKKIIEILPLPDGMDPAATAALLARGKKSLLFADSRSKVEKMKEGLERAGIRAFPHHGSLSRSLREESEEAFRSGSNCSIICTSTMELGLDVGDLDVVLQLGAPSTVSAFLQRLGRTGRRPGSTARMTFLCNKPEPFLVACALVSLAMKRWVEPVVPTRSSYPVYVHQVLARALSEGGATGKDLVDGQGTPYCFSTIPQAERERILEEMLAQEVLVKVDGRHLLGPEGERRFGRSNFMSLYSVFDTPPILSVRTQGHKEIGQLESWFIQSSDGNLCFLLGGQAWQTVRVDWKRRCVVVKPAARGAVPTWMGQPTLYTEELCQEVRALLAGDDDPAFLGERGLRQLHRLRGEWSNLIGDNAFTFSAEGKDSLVLYTFAGGKVNNVIARYHQFRTGQKVNVHNFHIKTTVSSTEPYWKDLHDTLESLAHQPLDSDTLKGMLSGLRQSRLSKFQSCLPADLEAKFLCDRLFDASGARQRCQEFLAHWHAPTVEVSPEVVAPAVPTVATDRECDDPFVAQLAELASTERATNKWIVVPNSRMKNTLGERLCLQGVDWLNFRFVTPFELALGLAAPELLARGVNPRPEGLGPPLVLQLLRALPAEVPQHFRPLVEQPRMPETLWSAIWELRMAGIGADQLPHTNDKQQEVAALFAAYDEYLAEHGAGDRATILQLALELVEACPIAPSDIVLETPSVLWSGLERRLLDSLPGRHLAARTIASKTPRRFAHLCGPRQPSPRNTGRDRHLLGALRGTAEATVANDSTLQFFQAGRRDAEIQEILRRVVERRIPLDQVELVPACPGVLPLLVDKLAQLGLEATFGSGLPVLSTRSGQALFGILDWLAEDFSAFTLRRLLFSGAFTAGGVGSLRAARNLERAGAKWGKDTYRQHLEPARRRAESAGYLDSATAIARLLEWVEELVALLPEPCPKGTVDVGYLASSLQTLLDRTRRWHEPVELAARGVLDSALGELQQLMGLRLTWTEALRQVSDRLQDLSCAAGRCVPGKLHVSQPSEAGMSGRHHIYIFGLEEGVLIPSVAEDPVFNDQERAALDPALALSDDRLQEASFLFLERLGSLSGEVTLSFSCRDQSTGEEVLPSWILFAAARLMHSGLHNYEQLSDFIGEPVGLIPDLEARSANEAEWWLSRLRGRGPTAASVTRGGFPWLCRGFEARTHRDGERFTIYDGLVRSLSGKLDPRESGRPASVSRLQDLADCAFRTYLKEGLGLRPIALEPPDPGLWLDHLQRGTLLHDVYADYYQRLRAQDRSPDATADHSLLVTLLETRLETLRPFLPPAPPAVESAERDALVNDLASFLTLESAAKDRKPVGFEVGFGLSELFEEEFATPDPVVLKLAEDVVLPLRGRIDRIDKVDGGYEVVDYKTGFGLARKTGVRYEGGRLIQHALYALVAEQLVQDTVTRSSYYFPIQGANRSWLTFPRPDEAELALLLRDLLAPLATGAFLQTQKVKSSCQYCDFRAACVGHSQQRSKAKLAGDSKSLLEWRTRLDQFR